MNVIFETYFIVIVVAIIIIITKFKLEFFIYSEIFLINNCQCQNEVKTILYHPKIWTYGPAV
jgi:hypothetical protein